MPENLSRKLESEMSVAAEMKQSIVLLAGPRQDADTRGSMIARAARRAGISFRQAKTFFYAECDNPRIGVVERVRAAINKANVAQEAKARAEYQHIQEQIQLLEQRLAAIDADLARSGSSGIQPGHRVDRALDRPMDRI